MLAASAAVFNLRPSRNLRPSSNVRHCGNVRPSGKVSGHTGDAPCPRGHNCTNSPRSQMRFPASSQSCGWRWFISQVWVYLVVKCVWTPPAGRCTRVCNLNLPIWHPRLQPWKIDYAARVSALKKVTYDLLHEYMAVEGYIMFHFFKYYYTESAHSVILADGYSAKERYEGWCTRDRLKYITKGCQ